MTAPLLHPWTVPSLRTRCDTAGAFRMPSDVDSLVPHQKGVVPWHA